jgi:hypothetical protein
MSSIRESGTHQTPLIGGFRPHAPDPADQIGFCLDDLIVYRLDLIENTALRTQPPAQRCQRIYSEGPTMNRSA